MSKSNAAIRLVSTKDLSHEDWLTARNRGIGGSDAAVAVGLTGLRGFSRRSGGMMGWASRACGCSKDLNNFDSRLRPVQRGKLLLPPINQCYQAE
jgi:hypothetical protein